MVDKRVDDDWKRKAREEKERLAQAAEEQQKAAEAPLPAADFSSLVSTFVVPLSMALGEMENPTTQKKEKDLRQAQYLIDLLGVLQEKTKGNLEAEEERLLQNLLTEYKFRFVQARQGE